MESMRYVIWCDIYEFSSTIPTRNKYKLSGMEMKDSSPSLRSKEPKVPPTFISGIQITGPAQTLSDDVEKKPNISNYWIKINSYVQVNKSEKYLPLIKALKDKGSEFHTFQRREESNF